MEAKAQEQKVSAEIFSGWDWFCETLCSDIEAFCENTKPEIKKKFPNYKYKPVHIEHYKKNILKIFELDFGKPVREVTMPQHEEAYSEGHNFYKYSLLYPGDSGDPFPILSQYRQAVPFPYNKEQKRYFILRRFFSIEVKDPERGNQIFLQDLAYCLFATENNEVASTNTINDFCITFCLCGYVKVPLDKEMPDSQGTALSIPFEDRFELGEAAVPKSVQEPVQSKEEDAPPREGTPHTTSSKETNAIPKSSTIDSFKVEDTHPSKIKTSTIVVISSFCVFLVLIIWLLIHKFAK